MIDVSVVPNSREETVTIDEINNRLKIKVNAPAEKGKANQALKRLVSKTLGTRCELCTGLTSRCKTLKLVGLGPDQAEEKIKAIFKQQKQ